MVLKSGIPEKGLTDLNRAPKANDQRNVSWDPDASIVADVVARGVLRVVSQEPDKLRSRLRS